MAFKKGISGNPDGRPAGKPNRTTEQLRSVLGDILHENLPRIREAIKNMDDDKLVMVVERLLKHYLPPPINSIDQFSEDDIGLLITKLREQQNKKLN